MKKKIVTHYHFENKNFRNRSFVWATVLTTIALKDQELLIVPTPTFVGREELKSPSSVEYGIKKIFSFFVFYRELSRFKVLRTFDCFLFTFSVIFAKIWHNIANIIQNRLKFLAAECCCYR